MASEIWLACVVLLLILVAFVSAKLYTRHRLHNIDGTNGVARCRNSEKTMLLGDLSPAERASHRAARR